MGTVVFGFEVIFPEELIDAESKKHEILMEAINDIESKRSMIDPLLKDVQEEDEKTINIVIFGIENLIENKNYVLPQGVFSTLRVLKKFVETLSPLFVQNLTKSKILSLLEQIASFKFDKQLENRGRYLLCHEKIDNPFAQLYGQQVYILAQECLQVWACWFEDTPCQAIFQSLKNKGVQFPQNFTYFHTQMLYINSKEMKVELLKYNSKNKKDSPSEIPSTNVPDEELSIIEKGRKKKYEREQTILNWRNVYNLVVKVDINSSLSTNLSQISEQIRQGQQNYLRYLEAFYNANKLFVASMQELPPFYSLAIVRSIGQSINDQGMFPFIEIFSDGLIQNLLALFEFQQAYYDQFGKQQFGDKFIRWFKSSSYVFDPSRCIQTYYELDPEAQYSKQFEIIVNNLINQSKLYFIISAGNTTSYYRGRYQIFQQKIDKFIKDVEEIELIQKDKYENTINKLKRKMQILQNKLVAFQYFKKKQIGKNNIEQINI